MKMVIWAGVLFVLSLQPMLIISSLIFMILLYSMYMYWVLSSFWFSYMIILVMMSGVLVIFTYMMSVLPNESFEVSSLVLVLSGLVLLLYKSKGFEEFSGWGEMLGSLKIWENSTMFFSMVLVIYLLFMMLMVVWLSMMEKGAIRIAFNSAWGKGLTW